MSERKSWYIIVKLNDFFSDPAVKAQAQQKLIKIAKEEMACAGKKQISLHFNFISLYGNKIHSSPFWALI